MNAKRRMLLVAGSVWFIAAAALGSRLAFAWNQERKIPHEILATVPFEQEAGNVALALSAGKGFSNLFRQNTGPTAWISPLYPFLLSLIFRFFGAFRISSFFAAVFLNGLFSAATTLPLFHLARRIAGQSVATISAWLWVVLPAGIMIPFEWIWDTSLSALLATTLLWATLRVCESVKRSLWLVYALLWAMALLTNPSLGIALPFLLCWAAVRARATVQISWRVPVQSLLLAVLCCLPWTIRNYAAFHRVIPVRSSLPFELWIGNNDLFDPRALSGIQHITRFEETRRYGQMGEDAFLADKWARATAFILGKPRLFLQLTGRRIIATWIGTEHPFDDFCAANSLLVRAVILCNALLTLGTVLGALLLFRSKSFFAFPLVVLPLFFPLVYYATHTSLRYRHPIDPVLIFLTVFAGARSIATIGLRKCRPFTIKTI